MFAVSWTHCYSPIENQVVPMTYLVAKPYSPRGSGRGECINNGRQALPSLVRPRFLPGDQKGPGPRVYRVVERSNFFLKRPSKKEIKLRTQRNGKRKRPLT